MDEFKETAVKNMFKILELLDKSDKDTILLGIRAKVEQAVHEFDKRRPRDEVLSLAKGFGQVIAFAMMLPAGCFLYNRPVGWPTCDLQHREELVWEKKCISSVDYSDTPRVKIANQFEYKWGCSPGSSELNTTTIDGWKCALFDDNILRCKQILELPAKF